MDTVVSMRFMYTHAHIRMYVRMHCACCVLFCAVRGYLPSSRDSQQESMQQMSGDQEKLSQLSILKQSLLLELKNFESNEKVNER